MSIHEQDRAYKRGTVLGFTLAEVVILIVFCLLLLFASSLKLASAPVDAAQTTREKLLREIAAELETMSNGKALDEFWREVRVAYYEARQKSLAAAGQPPAAKADPRALREVAADMDAQRGAKPLDTYWREVKWSAAELQRQQAVAERMREEKRSLEARLEQAEREVARLSAAPKPEAAKPAVTETKAPPGPGGHKWPPIITLTDAKGFYFRAGDAQLGRDFETNLTSDVIPRILKHAEDYGVDVIEIVGHTDEQVMQPRMGNLDGVLLRYLNGDQSYPLVATDNAGLGMARAAAVTRFLLNDPRLASRYKILPLSSAQILDQSGALADGKNQGDVRERRRIEIRLRRSNAASE